jgi:hypothetical protein
MVSILWFAAGIFAGLILTALGIIAAMWWPESKHDSVRPQFFAAVGDRPMRHPDSSAHGATPHDWSGPVWNPRSRMTEVPTRIARTELY